MIILVLHDARVDPTIPELLALHFTLDYFARLAQKVGIFRVFEIQLELLCLAALSEVPIVDKTFPAVETDAYYK